MWGTGHTKIMRDGKTIWNTFIENPKVRDHYSLFRTEPYLLFGEAIVAYDAGAHAGASLLCRASIEAALLTFLTRTPAETTQGVRAKGAWRIHRPRNRSGRPIRTTFEMLIGHIAARPVLTPRQLDKPRRIKGSRRHCR